jgi:hypothetical protein
MWGYCKSHMIPHALFYAFRKISICPSRCFLKIQYLPSSDMSSKLLKRNDASHATTKYWNYTDTSLLEYKIEYHVSSNISPSPPEHSVNL